MWKAMKKEYAMDSIGESPYFCKVCGDENFSRKKDLHRHLWTHFKDGRKPEMLDAKQLIEMMDGLGFESGSDSDDDLLSERMDSLKLRQESEVEKNRNRYEVGNKELVSLNPSASVGPIPSGSGTSDVRSKKCDYEGCQRSFNDRKMRRRHFLASHEGPHFYCGVCWTGFSRKYNRNKHVKKYHGNLGFVKIQVPRFKMPRIHFL